MSHFCVSISWPQKWQHYFTLLLLFGPSARWMQHVFLVHRDVPCKPKTCVSSFEGGAIFDPWFSSKQRADIYIYICWCHKNTDFSDCYLWYPRPFVDVYPCNPVVDYPQSPFWYLNGGIGWSALVTDWNIPVAAESTKMLYHVISHVAMQQSKGDLTNSEMFPYFLGRISWMSIQYFNYHWNIQTLEISNNIAIL